MALVMTAVSEGYEFFNYYLTLLVAPMFLFSGIFFPLDGLPAWTRALAQALPLTHAVALARPLALGPGQAALAFNALLLVLVCAASWWAATKLVARRLIT
jgi:lipooligosaccharide transport system permease protein